MLFRETPPPPAQILTRFQDSFIIHATSSGQPKAILFFPYPPFYQITLTLLVRDLKVLYIDVTVCLETVTLSDLEYACQNLELCQPRCVCENWKGYVVKHNYVN